MPISKIISRYYKSISNCELLSNVADRLYVYDNYIDGEDAQILFRLTNGEVVKQYTPIIPDWAKHIMPGTKE